VHRIFLSYSFQNEHQPLLLAVRTIIECAGFRVIDGKALDGFVVGQEVQEKIKACRAVVCVVTPEAQASGWVSAEFFQAVGQGQKRVFVLCHDGVDLGNPFQGIAVSRFSDDEKLSAITTLAGTLGLWRQSLGNSIRAVLLPEQVGQDALQQNAKCEYRCEEQTSFEESDWRPARLKPIDAGIHAILPEVPPEHSLQVRITFHNGIWMSSFVPQDLRLELKQ
jgi:hypothetical protein